MMVFVSGTGVVLPENVPDNNLLLPFGSPRRPHDTLLNSLPLEEKTLMRALRRVSRYMRLAIQSADAARGDKGGNGESCDDLGVLLGTTLGPSREILLFEESVYKQPQFVNPFTFATATFNVCAGALAIAMGARGACSVLTAELCSTAYAVAYATELLKLGSSRAILAGGVEELSAGMKEYLDAGGYDSTEVWSEGAITLFLEAKGNGLREPCGAILETASVSYHTPKDLLQGIKYCWSALHSRTPGVNNVDTKIIVFNGNAPISPEVADEVVNVFPENVLIISFMWPGDPIGLVGAFDIAASFYELSTTFRHEPATRLVYFCVGFHTIVSFLLCHPS